MNEQDYLNSTGMENVPQASYEEPQMMQQEMPAADYQEPQMMMPQAGYEMPQAAQDAYAPAAETPSPKKRSMKPVVAVILVVLIAITGTGLYKIWDNRNKPMTTPAGPRTVEEDPVFANVSNPDDYSTIYNAISKLNKRGFSGYGYKYMMNGIDFDVPESEVAISDSIPKSYGGSKINDGTTAVGSDKQDFSDTNVQVKGVQEADIIKTDGKYIYALNSDEKKLYTVETNNGQLKVVSEIELTDKYLEEIKEEAAQTPLASPTDPASATDAIEELIDSYNSTVGNNTEKIKTENEFYDVYQKAFGDYINEIDTEYREFYVCGDTLVVISEKYAGFRPRYYYFYEYRPIRGEMFDFTTNCNMLLPIHAYVMKGETTVSFYDYSDKTSPVFKNSVSMSGSYVSSRMVGDYLYFVTSESVYSNMINEKVPETFVPTMRTGKDINVEPIKDICILNNMEDSIYTNVCGVDVRGSGSIVSSKSLLGGGDDIYSNTENLYVYCRVYDYSKLDEMYKAKYGDIDEVEEIDVDENADDNDDYDEVEEYEDEDYEDEDYEEEDEEIDFGEDYYEFEQTQITKFAFKDGKIDLYASNTVNGEVINQFALDEYNGYLRAVVTNEGEYFGDDEDKDFFEEWNTLLIFDKNMKQVSSIEKIAMGEELKSVRFDGDIGYFVTFVQTDPLFTVDLKDPYDPKILSELKIPGFSTYLHPYGSGLLFGFGNAADEKTGRTSGLKLSMFDVSDKADVKEQNTLIFAEDNRTYDVYESYHSMALDNHKAILISPEKNLIGIPVSHEIWSYDDYESDSESKLSYIFFKYSEQEGFVQLGEAVVMESKDSSDWNKFYSIYRDSVRGMYIGDYLYVVSTAGCTSFTMDSFTKVASVEFGE